MTKNRRTGVFIMLITAVFLLIGCTQSSNIPDDLRAGEWKASSDVAEMTFTVNDSGTAVTRAVVDFTCSANALAISESLTVSTSGEGWPIKNGKFRIDFSDTSVKLTINGKFNAENTQASGSIKVRTCSGKWQVSR